VPFALWWATTEVANVLSFNGRHHSQHTITYKRKERTIDKITTHGKEFVSSEIKYRPRQINMTSDFLILGSLDLAGK
jgi:hypothetical protein